MQLKRLTNGQPNKKKNDDSVVQIIVVSEVQAFKKTIRESYWMYPLTMGTLNYLQNTGNFVNV